MNDTVRQDESAWRMASTAFGPSLVPSSTAGSSPSRTNDDLRVASSWPAPKNDLIVVLARAPPPQRLEERNLNFASPGVPLTASIVPTSWSTLTPFWMFAVIADIPHTTGPWDIFQAGTAF